MGHREQEVMSVDVSKWLLIANTMHVVSYVHLE